MSTVSIAEAWPPAGHPFTVADLDRMPDDGRRYELLDGMLAVSPRPVVIHQVAAARLLVRLGGASPGGYEVIPEPALQLSADTEFAPDLVVVPVEQAAGAKLTRPPLLAVEVRSPSTAFIDLTRKKAAYARFGAQAYWIVDPDRRRPSVTAFVLDGDGYAEATRATGDETFRAEQPYPVEFRPAQLVEGLPEG